MTTNANISCYLCGSDNIRARKGSVRDNSNVKILECRQCGLVFLSSFNHIAEEFYDNSGMHGSEHDYATWSRETSWDDRRRVDYLRRFLENKSLLDFGCGNGCFLLKARQYARYVVGIELEMANSVFFEQEKLKVVRKLEQLNETFDLITLFHVLEHLPDPKSTLVEISKKLSPGGRIIIEVPNANDVLLTLYDSDPFSCFTYWSCHLYYFTTETLNLLFSQIGFEIEYIKQVQRYPISNHLHWLSKGKPGGHNSWHFLDSSELNKHYESTLASIGMCDTIIASVKV